MPSRPGAIARLARPAVPVGWLVLVLWAIEVVNALGGHRLVAYGIVPRTAGGLAGIPLAPFLHGSLAHLAANTVPLAVLGLLVAIGGRGQLAAATIVTVLVGGAGIWLFGRPAYHVGASTLVFGYFGYLVARAVYERSFGSFAIAVLTLALYSGLLWGLLPQSPSVSWEGHLAGLAGGVLAAWMMRGR